MFGELTVCVVCWCFCWICRVFWGVGVCIWGSEWCLQKTLYCVVIFNTIKELDTIVLYTQGESKEKNKSTPGTKEPMGT